MKPLFNLIYLKLGFRYSYIRVLLTCILIQTTGCKKLITIDPPKSALVTSTVFSNNSSANAAIEGLYSQFLGSGSFASGDDYSLNILVGLSSDELAYFGQDPERQQFYQNSLLASNNKVDHTWQTAYSFLYQVNAIIEGLQNNSGVTSNVKNQLIGESKFLRAFIFFYLVNLWGDVPLTISTAYQNNANIVRSTKTAVYQQIITDLKDAQARLSKNYVGSDDITPTTERIRPNYWAATALLARVYLYTEDWRNAQIQAEAIINNSNLYVLSGYSAEIDQVI